MYRLPTLKTSHTAASARPLRPWLMGAQSAHAPASGENASTEVWKASSPAFPPTTYSLPPSAAAPQEERGTDMRPTAAHLHATRAVWKDQHAFRSCMPSRGLQVRMPR